MQDVILHLGYDGWWEQDMQELPLKRLSDAKVTSSTLWLFLHRLYHPKLAAYNCRGGMSIVITEQRCTAHVLVPAHSKDAWLSDA